MQSRLMQRKYFLLTLAICAVLIMTAIAYYPGLHGPFLFDDNPNIVNNSALHINELSITQLLRAAFSSQSGALYRPVSMLSFGLNEYFFGNSTYPFKLTNLFIHLINVLLILWLTRCLLINVRRRYGFDWSDAVIGWASILIAGAWALHPLNFTAVLYVVQRMTGLAALFTLAGILTYIYGRQRTLSGKISWPLIWLLTPAFGLAGVLCKEDAALLPLYLLLIEWLTFGFRNSKQLVSKPILIFYLCTLVLPGIIVLVFLATDPGWFLNGYALRDFTLYERLFTEPRVIWLYLRWTVLPDIRQLALFHDDIKVSTGLLTPITTLWSLLGLVVLIAIALWQRHRRPLLSLGILFFFAGQAMESTILPLEIAFEHRNYLPDYGLLLAILSLLLLPAHPTNAHARLSLRWITAVIVIPILFSVLLLRASEWDNYLDFTYFEALHHPDSPRAQYSLGQEYAILSLEHKLKTPNKALVTLTRAATLSQNIMPDVAMMIMSAKLERPINPNWAKHAEYILQNQPLTSQDISSLDSLINCLPTKCRELTPAAKNLIQAAFHTGNIQYVNRLAADLWVIYANYLTFSGAPLSDSIMAMQQSISRAPRIPIYRINFIRGLILTGHLDEAKLQLAQLAQLNLFGSLDYDLKKLNDELRNSYISELKTSHKT